MMKTYKISEAEDMLIGQKGTPERDEYEFELKADLIGDMIRKVRKERNLTQEELGDLIGVKRSQVSRLENNTRNMTIETILKVFNAMNVEVNFNIQY